MAEQPLTLTPEQVKRYSRHIIMSDVGSKGQRALMGAKALIIGAGGLGSVISRSWHRRHRRLRRS